MTIEDPVVPLLQWLFGGYGPGNLFTSAGNLAAAWSLIVVLFVLTIAVLFIAYVSFAAQYGPAAGFARVGNMIAVACRDLINLSLRRTFAMSWLAFQEAIRNKVLVAFAVFVLLMLFGSWFLDVKNDNPAQLYMSVVLHSTNYLLLTLALFLSTFSLPNDIKNRTIYTVVTKPVRSGELILGRMLGFTAIGTLILVVMCLLSYIFVWRGLSHTHEVEADNSGVPLLREDRSIEDEDGNYGWTGRTTEKSHHRHTVFINPDGTGFTDIQKGHRHRVFNRNGVSEPIAVLLQENRELRGVEERLEIANAKAQELENSDSDQDDAQLVIVENYIRQLESNLAELRTRLKRNVGQQARALSQESRSRAAKAKDNTHRDLYEDLAGAVSDAHAAVERDDLNDAIDNLKAAQLPANNVKISRYVVGSPMGNLQARMPQYGTLSFLDSKGLPTDKGVNVGNEWTYRSYIEGGSLAAAIWTFDDITPGRFPADNTEFARGVPLDLTLRVFRTHKGDIESGILGRLEVIENLPRDQVENGVQPLVSEPIIFYAQEFTADRKYIPRTLNARRGSGPLQEDLDLFADMAHDGKLIVRIRCEDRAQYFGAAKPDVYVWTGNNYFFANFAKGYGTLWCQMVLVIAFGVTLSTFLNGPIAMLATGMSYVTGYFTQFINDVSTGEMEGGGPLESMIRIVTQQNQVTPLEDGSANNVVYGLDGVMLGVMWIFSYLMPDYSNLRTASFVANGYNIPPELMTQHVLTTLIYVLVLATLGYLIFRSREVAA